MQPIFDQDKCDHLKALLHESPRAFGKAKSTWTLELVAERIRSYGKAWSNNKTKEWDPLEIQAVWRGNAPFLGKRVVGEKILLDEIIFCGTIRIEKVYA